MSKVGEENIMDYEDEVNEVNSFPAKEITMHYEREFSNFPNGKIKLHNFKNFDNDVADIINIIKSYQANGEYDEAAGVIQDNINLLSHYVVDAVTFRTWEEEIYNTQIYAKKVQQSVYFEDKEPEYCEENDIWIGVL